MSPEFSDLVSRIARTEPDIEAWSQQVALPSDKSYRQMRVVIPELPGTDIFDVANEDFISFLDQLIAHRDIDLSTFDTEISLDNQIVPGEPKRACIRREGS